MIWMTLGTILFVCSIPFVDDVSIITGVIILVIGAISLAYDYGVSRGKK
jgi:hypothetical protein